MQMSGLLAAHWLQPGTLQGGGRGHFEFPMSSHWTCGLIVVPVAAAAAAAINY
jgi:hypothetical protein